MRIAVAGATGVIGRHVVATLAERGHDPVPLARSLGCDVLTGVGLQARLAGVEVVVDTLSVVTSRRSVAEDFFGRTTERLLATGAEAGVGHHVALSIVGIDGIRFGYYQGKVAQEQAIKGSGSPWTILRATQFHEFADQMRERTRVGPVHLVPRMRSAPVAAREVAVALVDLATAGPRSATLEMAGPREEQVPDMVRRVLAARGQGGRVLAVRLPGSAGRAMAGGALLSTAPWRVGATSFEEWLASL